MPEAVTIRRAIPSDLPNLHAVIERAYRGDTAKLGWTHEADLLHDQRTDIETLAALVNHVDECILVAEKDGSIIGCVNLSRRENVGCYLGLLCIEPTLQSGGFGKIILNAAEHVAREAYRANHIVMTVIDSRSELIAYYERRGYARTGETCDFPVKLDPPLYMVILRKTL